MYYVYVYIYIYMYKSYSFSKEFKTNGAAQNNSNKRKFYIKNINPNVKLTDRTVVRVYGASFCNVRIL